MFKLKDLSLEGDDKNWTNAKLVNALIASKLRTIKEGDELWRYKQKKRANELDSCGNWLKYLIDNNGNKRLHDARFCHDKLCQICGARKYNHESARLYHVVNYLKELHNFMVGTFTTKNVPYDNINKEVNNLNYSWRKMRNYKAIKPYLRGTVKKVECKVGKNNKCNVHLHILMVVSPSFFYGKNSLTHSQWSQLWAKAVNKDYAPELHVERKGSYRQLKKTCNYIAKSYLYGDWKLKDVNKVIKIDDQTRGKHLIVYTGLMRDADNKINASYKRKNRISTGKHSMYSKKDNFNYNNTVTEVYGYKNIDGHFDYYKRE